MQTCPFYFLEKPTATHVPTFFFAIKFHNSQFIVNKGAPSLYNILFAQQARNLPCKAIYQYKIIWIKFTLKETSFLYPIEIPIVIIIVNYTEYIFQVSIRL